MVKRRVLDQVGIFATDSGLIAIEDIDLWLRIALKYKIKCTNESPLLLYRIQQQGVSYGYIQKLKRSLRLQRRYKKVVSNYLFYKSTIFTLGYILKEIFKSKGLIVLCFFGLISGESTNGAKKKNISG